MINILIVTVHSTIRSRSPTKAPGGLGRNHRNGWAPDGPAPNANNTRSCATRQGYHWAVEIAGRSTWASSAPTSTGDMESRARWTRFVAQEAWKRKMSFAYWEFCSGFGVYDPQKNQWIEPLKKALLAPAPAN